jgi:hypothetical protein
MSISSHCGEVVIACAAFWCQDRGHSEQGHNWRIPKMRNAVLRTLLLLCLAVPLAGQTGEWKTYRNVDGNFSVLFPTEPTDTINKSEGVQSHTLLSVVSPNGYTVVYTTMPNEQKVDDATFQIFKDAVFKELPKCSVVAEEALSPAIQGYVGHWYRLGCDTENGKMGIVGNLYWGRHHSYAVMVLFTTPQDPPTIKKFTDSFVVLDASK